MLSTRYGVLGALAAASLVMAGCGSSQTASAGGSEGGSAGAEITVTHPAGETTVTQDPQKVVVLDMAALDAIDALDEGDAVAGVAKGKVPEDLADYQDGDIPQVGSLKEPDFDAISEIGPDLIVAGGRTAEVIPELEKIAPTIQVMADPTEDPVEELDRNLSMLGEIFQAEDAATEEVEEVKADIEDAKSAAGDAGSTLVLSSGGGKISAFGPGSRFGIIHTTFGFTPADENIEESTHGQTVSFEFVSEADPETIFVVDTDAAKGTEGAQPAEQVLDNDLVKQTKAAQNDRIIYLDPMTWYIIGVTGPQALSDMAEEVQAA